MARRRLIIHGSQEEVDMFEPIYNTRLRLQHGATSSRLQLSDPPPAEDSEHEDDEPGAGHSITPDAGSGAGHHAGTDPCSWRSGVDKGDDDGHHSEEDDDGHHSEEDRAVCVDDEQQGDGSETQACPESETNTDLEDSGSDSDPDS